MFKEILLNLLNDFLLVFQYQEVLLFWTEKRYSNVDYLKHEYFYFLLLKASYTYTWQKILQTSTNDILDSLHKIWT